MKPSPIAVAAVLLALASAVAAADLDAEVIDQASRPLPDAVVVATPLSQGALPAATPGAEDVVDQVDRQFVPYVKAIRVGTRVRFPNKDNIRHHVYSFSPARRFELPLYAGTEAPPVLFDRPGVVVMGCNIHDWMVGYVYVSESPYFGKTGADGRVRLAGLPAGDYEVRVWHPDATAGEEATARTVRADAGGRLLESWKLDVRPSLKPRPAPGSGRGPGYR